ncbi:MAG: hypothetical protein GYA55_05120, partial [SAR324 cluster bacterium]|nr:hypothetical protein [SAR324 cluster bacterium]
MEVDIRPTVTSLGGVQSSQSCFSKELRLAFDREVTARNRYNELYSCAPEEDLKRILQGELSGAIQVQKDHSIIGAEYALPLSRVLSSLKPRDIFRIGGMEI